MTTLQAAQQILIQRTIDVFTDMRDTCESTSEYASHFGDMGKLIAEIEEYKLFGDICNAIETGNFNVIGLVGDDEEMGTFLGDVKNLMQKYSK